MKLEKFRAKGFIGFKRGLGLDEVSVDFTGHDGLIALSGQNGTSKSTLLELLSPFNKLASRSGALYQHVFLRDSEKELSFTYNGNSYRTLIKIDCQSEKSEGFIWKDGESLVNGKIREYSKKITEIFGSENLFFNSVFCSQNATKLSDMTTGELKGLFAEFLRLDELQAGEETTKQIINVLSGKASQIDVNISALQKRAEGAAAITDNINRLNEVLILQKGNKGAFSIELKAASTEREKIKQDMARNEVLAKQITELTASIEETKTTLGKEKTESNAGLEKLRTRYKELTHEIAEAEKILADEAAILTAVEKEKECTALINTLTANDETANQAVNKCQNIIHDQEIKLQEKQHALKQYENDVEVTSLTASIREIEAKITGYREQLSGLEGRDKSCSSTTCQFILAAKKAENELKEADTQLEVFKSKLADRTKIISDNIILATQSIKNIEEEIKAVRSEHIACQNMQAKNRQELARARMELSQYKDLSAKQADIAVAKTKKEDRSKAREENKKEGEASAAKWDVREKQLSGQITREQEKLATLQKDTSNNLTDELKKVEDHIKNTENSISATDDLIQQTNEKIAQLKGEITANKEADKQLQKANEDKLRLSADIADWTYIKNACGKNGLQAMEIDGAAPLITGYANDLLRQAFGALYSVKFLTQDEEGKECLDIITIGEDGEEILLDNLSGGQKCWILMALRLAMTLLSKEKGGRNFQTSFFDEMDGALDSDNAINFINLYKSFMTIGKFEAIPFISHKPECRSLADNVLMFESGKNPAWQ